MKEGPRRTSAYVPAYLCVCVCVPLGVCMGGGAAKLWLAGDDWARV